MTNFISIGKENDFIFQALSHMGNASSLMSWANNAVEDEKEVPRQLKEEMKQVNARIHELQECLRDIKNK
ncbi:hypothetical protein WMW72_34375 [Paenibacillus filicis]|uniref:Uncharacterized protein n=1 Tax=Paenibacillus filicis TaxID=669464 RepID=A0ABU9DXW6_9BACL